jgi:hypothetical protein
MEIDAELENLTYYFNKKLKKQRFFKSARLVKDRSGKSKYTFFIGSPGLFTAIAVTFLLFLAIYLSTSTNKTYPWLIYLFLCSIFLPVSLKIDRVNQIRTLSMQLICEAINLLKKSNCNTIDIQTAKELLVKSSNFVEEPGVQRQIKIINNYLKTIKPL